MAAERYDAVVLGLGAMGSAALYHLAARGLRVCGVEQHHVAHGFGSSHGRVRVIRKAYFEHPDYVPLLDRAYELWAELERESGKTLLVQCGLLLGGPPGSETMRGLEACYRAHRLPHERYGPGEGRERFPKFTVPEPFELFFDPLAGYLFIEDCIAAYLDLAERHGAEVRIHEPAAGWKPEGGGVRVTTAKGDILADRLVLTLGPWAAEALRELGLGLRVLRKVQLWYDAPDIDAYRAGFPAYFFEMDYGQFYGFPAIGEWGLKVAEHSGGRPVEDPAAVHRGLDSEDEAPVLRFLAGVFPGLRPARAHFSVCMYTMTPDGHFVLDVHPEHPQVVLAAGFSGHGFKFAPVIGEVLADLAQQAATRHPIDFLRLGRFVAKL